MSGHLLTWAAWNEPRWEQAHVEIRLGRMHARGIVLAGGDTPCGFVTTYPRVGRRV